MIGNFVHTPANPFAFDEIFYFKGCFANVITTLGHPFAWVPVTEL